MIFIAPVEMLSGLYLARFGVLFSSVVLGCRYNLKLLDPAVSGAHWLIRGGFLAHRYTYRRVLAAEARSTAGLLFLSQYLCATILPTLIRWCETGGF